MPVPEEFDLQRAYFQWLVGWPDRHGVPTKPPALLPGVECWHTPNSGEGRSAFQGKRLKEMGVQAGVHDLLFLRPTDFGPLGKWGLLYGMEWKKPGGGLHASQKIMQPRLMAAGMAAEITVDNLVEARAWSASHMLTIRF